MKTFRLYTGSDGQSHVEPIDLGRTPAWTKGLATTQIAFRESPVGNFIDWHPAPRRQFVITLTGEAEITASDGEVRRVGPGSVMLAEDTTGKGHITRTVGGAERLSIFVPVE